MVRGIHSKPNDGISNNWITPKSVIDNLGQFDLDPCACSEMPWVTANHMISPPANGLEYQWSGRVWLNPPYGSQLKTWIERLANHGNGIALVPSRTEVESWFWPFIWEKADAVFFFRGRLYFHRPDGSREGNAGHGSVLAIYGKRNVEAVRCSVIQGKLIEL